ncbi:MAG: O-antigen ligase family protein [Bacteroidales bacterium]|nr:O-antigen ligase family protein [Bacteroidales bacterium]
MTKEIYWSLIIPAALLFFILYFISLDKILLIIVFLTPLAINIRNFDSGFSVSLPTEPLLAGVVLIYIIRLFYFSTIDFKVLKHPITIIILLSLLWMSFTSLTSELPFVSFKYLIARLWFVIPFYFLGIHLFKDYKNIKRFSWAYVIPLLGVIFYTLFNHAIRGFSEEAGHWVMNPFYNDHTAYGTILAFFIPIFIGFTFNSNYSRTYKLFAFFITSILFIALFFSFSRAAWISLVVSFGVYIIIILKIKFRWIFLSIAVIIGLFLSFQNQILDSLERNKQDSSQNFIEHIQSISNISSDASNLERINRWQSAIRMFKEKPILGWGPGTYQFFYASYQRSKEKTIISTNAGDMGNAHSEYIGPLAEMGVLGSLFMILLVIFSIRTGLKVYRRSKNKEVKLISLATMLGLITYFVHGLLNNFLDSDKASVPFWGFIAIIVTLDLYYTNKKPEANTTDD